MADEKESLFSKAGQGANWLVGLAGAAVGGGLAKLDELKTFPLIAKCAVLLATLGFLVAIIAGIFYYFETLEVAQAKEKLDKAEAAEPPDPQKLKEAKKARTEANGRLSLYHYGSLIFFSFASLATFAGFCDVIFAAGQEPPKPPAAPPPNHFSIVNVPVQINGRLSHSHTFLLDEQTGDTWLMMCQPNNKSVEFRRVSRLKLDGTSEGASSSAMPKGAAKSPVAEP